MWQFGLRVHVQAVTNYLICDAKDPLQELFRVQATYHNRLAFSLKMTPFVECHVRHDAGHVVFEMEEMQKEKQKETQEDDEEEGMEDLR